MTGSILITGGRVVDPGQGIDREMEVLIIDGKIAAVATQKGISRNIPRDCEVFDAKGLVVSPGLIDMHCHLREPGVSHFSCRSLELTPLQAASAGRAAFPLDVDGDPLGDVPLSVTVVPGALRVRAPGR